MFGFSKGEQGLSYSETAQRLEINSHSRIKDWERVYLTEGPEGFQIERRGRGSNGRPATLPKMDCVEKMIVAPDTIIRIGNQGKDNS